LRGSRLPEGLTHYFLNGYQLKALTRQHQAITEARTVTKNQLHAINHSAFPMRKVIKRYEQIIKLQDDQLNMIDKEIKRLAKKDPSLDDMLNLLISIPGVALKTASAIIAETGGFQLFDSRAQLIKYAGMDIKSKISGSSVKGRSTMSKAGNSRIRRALYMPSLQYIKREDMIGQLYRRVYDRSKIKMKALVAVQRKLLVIMYAIVKSGVPYDSKLHQSRCQNRVGEPELVYSDSMS
jgi:transposase